MKMAADLSLIRFKDEAEMLQYKKDFQSALLFVRKLEEVDVSGVEPLSNVLEFYGGNEEKMRSTEADFEGHSENILKDIRQMNKNMQGALVKTPKPFDRS